MFGLLVAAVERQLRFNLSLLLKAFLLNLVVFNNLVDDGVALHRVHGGKTQEAVLCLVDGEVAHKVGEHDRNVEQAVVARVCAVHRHHSGVEVSLA